MFRQVLRTAAPHARLLGLTLGLTLALTGVAGCGDDNGSLSQARDYAKTSGGTIADEARAAMKDLKSVHIDGNVLEPDGTRVLLDLDVSGQSSCKGTIHVGDGKIELRAIGSGAWYRADETFWTSIDAGDGKRIARKVGKRWVKLSGELGTLRTFCSIDSLTAQMLPAQATIKSSGPAMVDAVPTVRMEITRGQDSSRAYVVGAAPHRIAWFTQGQTGELKFKDFNKSFDVTAPAAGQVFDLKKLEKK